MSSDPATYVEGVPVKIVEKYRPPRKVTLSASCSYHVNTDVLTTEYDVSIENETLKWLQNLKNHKENKVKIREEKIQKYEEEKERLMEEEERIKQQKLEENERRLKEENEKKIEEENEMSDQEDEATKDKIEDEVENIETEDKSQEIEKEEEKNRDTETPSSQTDVNSVEDNSTLENCSFPVKTDVPAAISNGTAINYNYTNTQPSFSSFNSQQPSYPPMLVPTQCSPQTTYHKSPTKSSCNINFAEFEGDASDPFDSVALKSINDMEELAKVLQTSNIRQPKGNSGTDNINFNYQQRGTQMNGGYQYNPYSYMNYQQSNLPLNTSIYNQISSYQSKISSPSTTPSVPSAVKSNAVFQHDSFPPTNYSQWNHAPRNSNTRSVETSQFKPYNYAMPQTVLHNNSNAPMDSTLSNMGSAFPNMTSQIVGTSLTTNNIQTLNAGLKSVGKRQDLEDFYTRYYSNKKLSPLGVCSGDSTPTNIQQASKTISSSSSVPDLTAVEDNEVLNIVSNNHFERGNFKGSINVTPPRPSSTGGYEGLNRPFQMPVKPWYGAVQKNRLPDPFTELTEDAQVLVQSMAEMGFPRPRVARAVQKLGTDHKKLLEVLLTLQSFQENGEDEYRSERAFYFFMGEVAKVNEFLHASKMLLDLGFEEEKVIEYLFKHQNDKEKCLEELIA